METTVRLDACQFWSLWFLFIALIASIMLLTYRVKERTDYFKEQDKIDRMWERIRYLRSGGIHCYGD